MIARHPRNRGPVRCAGSQLDTDDALEKFCGRKIRMPITRTSGQGRPKGAMNKRTRDVVGDGAVSRRVDAEHRRSMGGPAATNKQTPAASLKPWRAPRVGRG
jgi:hypothetical protein